MEQSCERMSNKDYRYWFKPGKLYCRSFCWAFNNHGESTFETFIKFLLIETWLDELLMPDGIKLRTNALVLLSSGEIKKIYNITPEDTTPYAER